MTCGGCEGSEVTRAPIWEHGLGERQAGDGNKSVRTLI